MNAKDLYGRVMTVFGGLMVFFYIGFGLFIIVSQLFSYIDKFIRIIFGSALIFYGVVRAIRTYEKVREIFYDKGNLE